jgi:predicted porin
LNAGIKVGFDNIKVGVSYMEDNNGVANNGDTDIFVVGASYKMDAYTFGVSYYDRSDEQNAGTHTVAGDLDTKRWALGAAYKYGPGMSFNAAVSHVEAETSVAGDEERSGYQFTLGTNISF